MTLEDDFLGRDNPLIGETLRELASRLGGIDELVSRQLSGFSSVLDELCRKVNQSNILEIKKALNGMFDDSQVLESFFGFDGRFHNIIPVVYANLAKEMNGAINNYLHFTKSYAQLESVQQDASSKRHQGFPLTASAARALPSLINQMVREYVAERVEFPDILGQAYKLAVSYNNYLRKRFIKAEEKKSPEQQEFLVFDPNEENQVKYVKIELVENNPVLTDLLLRLADEIPVPQERPYSEKNRKKVTKEVNKYAIDDAAEKLVNCADTQLLTYIREPRVFFAQMAYIAQTFYNFFHGLDDTYQKIINLPNLQILGDMEGLEDKIKSSDKRIRSGILRLNRLDFEAIVQKKDEVQPDNRREIDYFKVRGKLLDLLYTTLQELAELKTQGDVERSTDFRSAEEFIRKNTPKDVRKRELIPSLKVEESPDFQETLLERAREKVMKAVELKAEMEEIATSHTLRQLRKDKASDNEFYIGRQGEIGRFYFEREPTPKVKMEEVIGASFDQAKDHLKDIIETGSYSRVMRLSAPGGKVRSNILLIGPFGCGKTELARAACADERVIGANVSVASTLTAYMHESVNNVKRVYDAAKHLRQEARDMKPVLLTLDEFDGWFAHSENGGYSETDMQQIENIMLEVLDGMEDYNGVITLAMTNKPKMIPKGIMRRFRYVDIVGELTTEERAGLLKMYLEKTLPIHESVPENYSRWAEKLADAPGDVVRKVVDELHFQKVPGYLRANKSRADRMERILYNREINKGELNDKDIAYVQETLRKGGVIITPLDVEHQIDQLLVRPAVRMQINAAREVYRDAKRLLEELASGEGSRYGLKSKSKLFE